jgi:nucleotidyltransferase/DNA polymerase involved in DNA repair
VHHAPPVTHAKARIRTLQYSIQALEQEQQDLEKAKEEYSEELGEERVRRTTDRARAAHTLSRQHDELQHEREKALTLTRQNTQEKAQVRDMIHNAGFLSQLGRPG